MKAATSSAIFWAMSLVGCNRNERPEVLARDAALGAQLVDRVDAVVMVDRQKGVDRLDAAADAAMHDISATSDRGIVLDSGGSACASGEIICDGVCVNTKRSSLHCGRCGVVCRSGLSCVDGVCGNAECSSGETSCNGRCVNTAIDSSHCGRCARVCSEGQVCQSGGCVTPTCAPPLTLCGADCVDLMSTAVHCGRCGNMCTLDKSCVSGSCVIVCDPVLGPRTPGSSDVVIQLALVATRRFDSRSRLLAFRLSRPTDPDSSD